MNERRRTIGNHQLDLTDEAWPVCLLKFKSELNRVAPGRFLEVVVADPDIVDSVGKILRYTEGRIIRIDREKDRFRILIHCQRYDSGRR